MANLTEVINWETGIYQLETTDPVLGGPSGIDNLQAKQLGNRTQYLKKHIDDLEAGTTVPPGIATQTWVNNLLEQRDLKQSVRATTTANISLSGAQTIDGVSVTTGDRVLVKNQTAPAENGIYVVSASAWTRAIDADESEDVTAGMEVFVSEGTLYADTIWKLTTNDTITLGTTALTFVDITNGYAPLASPNFTGNPSAPTPAQFDNDTSIATTAFVRSERGSMAGNSIYSASGTIAVADVGKRVISSTAGITLNLPLLSAVPVGSVILVHAGGGGITLATSGSDAFLAGDQAPATIAIKSGSTAWMMAAPSNWVLESGDTLNAYSKFFDASLAAVGYQKLPSGLIIQWGTCTPTGSADAVVTFPVAFPTAAFAVFAAASATSGLAGFANYNGITASGVNVGCYLNSGARAAFTASWMALGK